MRPVTMIRLGLEKLLLLQLQMQLLLFAVM